MKEKILSALISIMLKELTGKQMKKFADFGLDMLEEQVKKSKNKIDDKIILPLIETARNAFDIK